MSTYKHDTPIASAPVLRPNVLAYVSPTTTRLIVLLGALLSAGLSVGTMVHNQSPLGDDWQRRVLACNADNPVLTTGSSLAQVPEFRQCTAGVERRRAAFAVAGASVAALGGIGVMAAAPRVIERRRRLRAAGSRLAPAVERFDALAREVGMTRAPKLVVGPSTLRDAFSYGTPGRYRVALPPAIIVRWRDPRTFDPLVRHELAHVAYHDVAAAWLARSMWLVVAPLLMLPFLTALLSGDFSVLSSYVWRAGLVATVTLLASAALLRSREHDADLRAARSEAAADDLRGLLDRISTPVRTGWRQRLAYHPSAADRRTVLDEPGRHADVTFLDGLTAAFLAALTFPLLMALVSTVSAGASFGVSAAIVGPSLGATVGLGLWRQALVGRITGARRSVAPAALGVLVGYGFGEAASLAGTGLGGGVTGYDHAALGALTALAAAGATVVAAGLGELFADASACFPTARAAWVSCIVLVGALFAVVLWAATTLAAAFDGGGWNYVSAALVTILGMRTPAFVALLLAAVSAWALRVDRTGGSAPPWAVQWGGPGSWQTPEKPHLMGALLVGIAAGTVGALVLVGFRLLNGSGQPEQRYYLALWVFAGVGAAAALGLVAAQHIRGVGVALLASPVASLTAAAGFVVLNSALGGSITWTFLEGVARPGVALGLLLLLVVAIVSLMPRPQPRKAGTLATVAAASALAGVISLGVVAGRAALLPEWAAIEAVVSGQGPAASSTTEAQSASPEAATYATMYAPSVEGRMAAIEGVCGLDGEATSSTAAERELWIRAECLEPAQSLLDEASGLQPSTAAVQAAHEQLLAALQARLRTYEILAAPHEADDLSYLSRLRHEVAMAEIEWWGWQAAVAQLSVGDEVAVQPTEEPATGPAPPTEAAEQAFAGNVYSQRTCESFRRMVEGSDALSQEEQRALLDDMADTVAQSGDPDLMRSVADFGQGALAGEPERFAAGMRALSVMCGVPYE